MKKRRNSLFSILRKIFVLFLKKSPGALFLYIISGVLSGGFLAFTAVFKENFFNDVENSIVTNDIQPALISGAIMGGALLLSIAFAVLFGVVEENFFAKLRGNLGVMLNKKASKIDLICYEDNKLLDEINKAQNGLDSSARVFGYFAYVFFNLVPYFIVISIYFASVKTELLIMLATAFIPCIISCILRYRIFKKSEVKLAPIRRKSDYYAKCITEKEFAKETRLLGSYGFFFRLFKSALHDATTISWKASKRDEINELIAKTLVMIGYLATVATAIYFLLIGEIRVGAFAAVIGSLDTLFDYLENVFNYCIGGVTRHLPMAKNFQEFMNLPERHGEVCSIDCKTFKLQNVSFKYPNQNTMALSNINLEINDGETIAIVGENGAGKSTIVKLLMGLYLPTEGDALIDDVNTKNVDPSSLFKNTSAVFQNFIKYKMTLKDNVYLSNTSVEFDLNHADESIVKSDLNIDEEALTEGYDTMLSKEFGKVDLSGGQWQRLAIARGFYRNHNFIVLDEPTAAIDPIEETKLYNKFSELSKDKTAIIVTHRLGSAKVADRIVVMDNGFINDIGTHEELMKRKGKYYDMYTSQAEWYM